MSWDRIVQWLGDNQEHFLGSGLRVAGVLIGALLLVRLLRKAVTRVEGKVPEHTTPVRGLQRTQTITKVVQNAER